MITGGKVLFSNSLDVWKFETSSNFPCLVENGRGCILIYLYLSSVEIGLD